MKKFLLILFICLLLPVSVSAETNYLEGFSWEKGLSAKVEVDGLNVKSTDISVSYSSPYLDLMPAFKRAIGDDAQITMRLSFKIRGDFEKEPSSKINFIIRSITSPKQAREWLNYHKAERPCSPAFFPDNGTNNIMKSISSELPNRQLTDAWQSFEIDITATREQIFCPVTPAWYFCVDGLSVEKGIKAIYFEDVTLTKLKSIAVTPFVPIAKPIVEETTPTPKATPTPTPTPLPTPDWLDQPIVDDMSSMVNDVVRYIVNIIIAIGLLSLILFKMIMKK